MKQSTTTNCPSDEVIERLFFSKSPADWRIATIFTIEKYKYKDTINEFFSRIGKDYRPRTAGRRGIHIFIDKEAFLQIIVGCYGLWAKSNYKPAELKSQTTIEEI